MSNVVNRNSVLALVTETTEGTPVNPTVGSQFCPLSDGFSFAPNFDTLTSAELASSIGPQKALIGGENPSISFDHYMRASGTVAQASNIDVLLHSLLGAKTTKAAEVDTIVGSTVSAVNVDVGEGAGYRRGMALLKKSGTYEVRNVLSVTGDVLTLAQNLAVAPPVSTNLGRPILYRPANDGSHPTFTSWLYRGNGGLIESVAGCRTLSLSLSVDAEQFITGSYSIEGIKYYYNPIRTTATSKFLDFSDSTPTVFDIELEEKLWTTPHDLAQSIQDAMNNVGSVDVFTVVYNDRGANAGKFTFTSDGTVFSLLWNTGANSANSIAGILEFSAAADDTLSLTYSSDNAQDWSNSITPAYDTTNPNVAKNIECIVGEEDDIACFGVSTVTFDLTNTKANIQDICEESGKSGSLITERVASASIVARVAQHDVKFFEKFRTGGEVSFTLNFGPKLGGNWVEGSVCNIHMPTCTVSEFSIDDQDGIAILNMTVSAFVKDGLDEVFVNML